MAAYDSPSLGDLTAPSKDGRHPPYLAVDPNVSLRAGAHVGAVAVQACAPILAGLGVALVDVMLAVDAGEARETQAGEGIDPIRAGAAIEAGTRETQEARGGG